MLWRVPAQNGAGKRLSRAPRLTDTYLENLQHQENLERPPREASLP